MPFIPAQDMSQVQKWGEALPEGWYKCRCAKVEVADSKNTPGEKVVWITNVVQEEPHTGAHILDFASLQAHALAKLKAYYEAAGYTPGPEGHDPETLVGREYYVLNTPEVYQGTERNKVPPYGVRSIQEGKPIGVEA